LKGNREATRMYNPCPS